MEFQGWLCPCEKIAFLLLELCPYNPQSIWASSAESSSLQGQISRYSNTSIPSLCTLPSAKASWMYRFLKQGVQKHCEKHTGSYLLNQQWNHTSLLSSDPGQTPETKYLLLCFKGSHRSFPLLWPTGWGYTQRFFMSAGSWHLYTCCKTGRRHSMSFMGKCSNH